MHVCFLPGTLVEVMVSVGAIASLLAVRAADGSDPVSSVVPDRMTKEIRTPAFCTQCRSRCGCEAVTAEGRLLRLEPLPSHPSGDKLCPKGRAAPELVEHPDRLVSPMRRSRPKGDPDPGWVAISWDEALDEIAGRMRRIATEHGPEQVAFSVTTPSGTHLQDSISWIERLIRAYGSPNTIYSTEICNWHKDFASRFTYGWDIGTPDFAKTDCVLLWGHNPQSSWLARSGEIQKALKRGARMVVVDPRPTTLARRADCWLQVRPGTDQAVALGLARLLIVSGRFDRDFITRWTNGPLLVRDDNGRFLTEADMTPDGSTSTHMVATSDTGIAAVSHVDAAEADIDATRMVRTLSGVIRCRTAFSLYREACTEWSPDRVAAVTGVAPETLRAAADVLSTAKSVAYYCWNGVGQSLTATQTDRAISTLYALTGSYGRRGGNVPGGAASFADISGRDLISATQSAKALGLSERPLGPGLNGWVTARDVYRAVLEKQPYPVRMLMSFGGNLLAAQPDTDRATHTLRTLEFHAHADFFVNATARYADILLPAATSWEREGLRTGFDVSLAGLKRVQLRPAVVAPRGEARSDTDIVMGLATRLGLTEKFFCGDVDQGHNAVLAPAGLSVDMLRSRPEGVDVAGEVAFEPWLELAPDGNPQGFPTPTRRLELYSERLLSIGQSPLPTLDASTIEQTAPSRPLLLGSSKTVAYCHSQHRNIASLRRLEPDPPIEMTAYDAAARGIANGDWARIITDRGSAVGRVRIIEDLARGTVFGQHGWWTEGPAGTPYDASRPLAANLNGVIDTTKADPISGSIPLRATWCEVERIDVGTDN